MRKSDFKVSAIVPIYNEEGCIELLAGKVKDILSVYSDYEIIFIDDGSVDRTLAIVKELRNKNIKIHFLSFSRNFGHQNAIRAGIDFASGDCIISLDGDLQHPPELIPRMIEKWKEGIDIVYTIRKDTREVSFLKRITAKLYYKILNSLSDIDIELGAADFRLIDKKVAKSFKGISENEIFFRGMIKWVGFSQFGIEYNPAERCWGETKYSVKKMMTLAFSGITGFSIKPLRISFFVGLTIALLSLIYGIYALCVKIFTNKTIEGWTSVFFMVTLIGGIQLIMVGILGEYIGKLFIESKKRPNYILKETSYKVEE